MPMNRVVAGLGLVLLDCIRLSAALIRFAKGADPLLSTDLVNGQLVAGGKENLHVQRRSHLVDPQLRSQAVRAGSSMGGGTRRCAGQQLRVAFGGPVASFATGGRRDGRQPARAAGLGAVGSNSEVRVHGRATRLRGGRNVDAGSGLTASKETPTTRESRWAGYPPAGKRQKTAVQRPAMNQNHVCFATQFTTMIDCMAPGNPIPGSGKKTYTGNCAARVPSTFAFGMGRFKRAWCRPTGSEWLSRPLESSCIPPSVRTLNPNHLDEPVGSAITGSTTPFVIMKNDISFPFIAKVNSIPRARRPICHG